jgi:fructokinase
MLRPIFDIHDQCQLYKPTHGNITSGQGNDTRLAYLEADFSKAKQFQGIMTTKRALIFGEVLFDIFEDGEAVLGGAPFNVAWHLHGFGANPLFVSRIGEDALGQQVSRAMQEWGMDRSGLQIDPLRPTGSVSVTLDAGQPSYTINEDAAYDFINTEDIQSVLTTPPDLLYHGSLITRHDTSRQTLLNLRHSLPAPLFVDINLRAPWHRREQAEPLLSNVSWLKLNEDELQVFAGRPLTDRNAMEMAASDLLAQFGWQLIIVTMGSEGAFLVKPDTISHTPPAPTEDLIDTVGAGDALSSVILLGILNDWDMEITLQRAVGFASAICEQKGATSFNRDLYHRFLEVWNY